MKPFEGLAAGRHRTAPTFQNIRLVRGDVGAGQRSLTGAFDQYEDRMFWQSIWEGQAERRRDREPPKWPKRSSTSFEIQAIRKTPVSRLSYGLRSGLKLGARRLAGMGAAVAAEPSILLAAKRWRGMNVERKRDMEPLYSGCATMNFGRRLP